MKKGGKAKLAPLAPLVGKIALKEARRAKLPLTPAKATTKNPLGSARSAWSSKGSK